MFRITKGRGFQMAFDNGLLVSVQFGPDNYCENRLRTPKPVPEYVQDMKLEKQGYFPNPGDSPTAEVAVIEIASGNFLQVIPDNPDEVAGWQKSHTVAHILKLASEALNAGDFEAKCRQAFKGVN